MTELICRDERRRGLVRERGRNGLDYLEVGPDQCTLTVFFLLKGPAEVTPDNVRVEGGRRVREIRVVDVRMCRQDDPDRDDCMLVHLDRSGDFSPYRLRLVRSAEDDRPPPGVDPRYAALEFSFKVDCPSELDCAPAAVPVPAVGPIPELSYLAKDYASLRQLLFDRLAVTMPQWREQHVPDLGVALAELLAYAGDQLSYYQDAVATEAYLDTARLRISIRRHARLVDYRMHEGCNARAWVCLATDTDLTLPADVSFLTAPRDGGGAEVFAPVEVAERTVYASHSKILFYTWGDAECCLDAGATGATLLDQAEAPDWSAAPTGASGYPTGPGRQRVLHLEPGDVLILEEVRGPRTGLPDDADRRRRHAALLTDVRPDRDPVNGALVLEVEWAAADALPFPLCLSAVGLPPACEELTDVGVARGNVVLVDHGRWVRGEELGTVRVREELAPCADAACGRSATYVPEPLHAVLAESPVTFRAPLPPVTSAAALAQPQDPRAALPVLDLTHLPLAPGDTRPLYHRRDLVAPEDLLDRLREAATSVEHELRSILAAAVRAALDRAIADDTPAELAAELQALLQRWQPVHDLLGSTPTDRHVVVEVDNDGRAHLRFGDGRLGLQPPAHARFAADYRVGNGPAGNVGADTIVGIAFGRTVLRGVDLQVRNPLPAWGGLAPESVHSVKLRAPTAFRRQLVRAVTADDYARLAEGSAGVQRAAAALRFTGSTTEVRVGIDAVGGVADQPLLAEVAAALEPFRRIGHDVVVVPATYVPLDVAITVCVRPEYLPDHVLAAVTRALSSTRAPDGTLGFFAPDNFTFGDSVRAGLLVAAVMALPGVENAEVTCLRRLDGDDDAVAEGVLRMGPLEVARLDQDPDAPENGRLRLDLQGGRR